MAIILHFEIWNPDYNFKLFAKLLLLLQSYRLNIALSDESLAEDKKGFAKIML